MEVVKKQFNFEIKQLGEEKDRILRFVGSTEDVDRDSDIIEVSGWKTDNYMKNPVVLWAHNGYSLPPIGKTIKVEKDIVRKKLMFDIQFPTIEELSSDIENPAEHAKFVDMIYNMCKNGYLNSTSVGFRGIKFKTRDDSAVLQLPEWQRGRRYIEQELNEISIVNIPANQNALIEARGKGLIDDIAIKSFFNAQKEGEEMNNENENEKSGARLSKETIESCKNIMEKMQAALDSHGKAHKEAMKAYNGCMDEWKQLVGDKTSDGVLEDNGGAPDGVEEPKSLEPDLVKSVEEVVKKTLKSYFENVSEKEKVVTKIDNSIVIDLDNIEIPTAEKSAERNELNVEPEELKQAIREMLEQKINFLTGKV